MVSDFIGLIPSVKINITEPNHLIISLGFRSLAKIDLVISHNGIVLKFLIIIGILHNSTYYSLL